MMNRLDPTDSSFIPTARGTGPKGGGPCLRGKLKYLLWAICSFWFLSGCAASGPEIVAKNYPVSFADKAILIQHFTVYPEIATHLDKAFVQELGANLAYDIQSSLKKAGFSRPLVITAGEPANGDFLIKGTIT
ncbi:MAG: hypothetical protein NTY64_05595, partial [Deltaproteobacteria bacterium]|nr:hypothetical protein [Deltaproteobacteria bacterium]